VLDVRVEVVDVLVVVVVVALDPVFKATEYLLVVSTTLDPVNGSVPPWSTTRY
jgi:hypothetical protein